MHTEVDILDAVLFTKSYVNDVVAFMLEILKNSKKMEQHFQDVAQKSWTIRIRNILLLTLLNVLHKSHVHNNVARLCLSEYFVR